MIRLTDEQWERIRNHFPEEQVPDGRPGRKPISTRRVLEAVNNRHDFHAFSALRCSDLRPAAFRHHKRRVDEAFFFIERAFVAKLIGYICQHPSQNLIATPSLKAPVYRFVIRIALRKHVPLRTCVEYPQDRHGLPLSVSTHAANHHEVRLVQLCFDFYMIEAKPENLIGDRAYDSDPLDEELRQDGIEMIAPHRANRSKPRTQDRRRLTRYMRRWLVERFFAWIQWQRRILVRWEYHTENFLGFVQLACLVILFRRF